MRVLLLLLLPLWTSATDHKAPDNGINNTNNLGTLNNVDVRQIVLTPTPPPSYGGSGGSTGGGTGGSGGSGSGSGGGASGPANPYMQQAAQLMQTGDRAGACLAAQRAMQQMPGDENAAGMVRLNCDQRGGNLKLDTTKMKRHEIDSSKYQQEKIAPDEERQQQPGGRDPMAGDVKDGKQFDESRVGVPSVPLGTIAQPVTSYDKMMSAQDQVNHGRYADAALSAAEAIALDPRNVKAHVILAAALEAEGKHEEALKAAEDGLKLAPQNVNLLKSKAAAKIKTKDYDSAIEAADAALTVNATDAMANLLKAYAYGKKGDAAEMLKLLAMAAALDPSYEKYLIEAQNGGRNGEPFVLPYDEAPETYQRRIAARRVDPSRNKKIALFFGLLAVLFVIGGLLIYAVVSYRGQAAEPSPAEAEPVNTPGP